MRSRRSAHDRLLHDATFAGKYIGTVVSLPFHQKLKEEAQKRGTSLGGFLRQSLIEAITKEQH